MSKIKISILLIVSFIICSFCNSEIQIKYKIDDKIVTNIDILEEKKYLIFLRPNLAKLSENEIIKISENSIVREIIKSKEIDRIFKKKENKNFTNEIKRNLFLFKGVKSEEEFLKILKETNLEYKKILKKIEYEGLWNELIFQKYNNLIKIDKEEIKKKLIKNYAKNKRYEYNLSEILFEIEQDENFDKKYQEIINYVKKNEFKAAASKYSISNSSNRGGEIGWVKETVLSSELIEKLKKLKINEVSEPIRYPNGYLLIKINKKKEMKQKINLEQELGESIKYEKNKQLNQFSLLYYKKLKQNTQIYEY